MIHIEKLMGAKSKEIRSQLFLDAALTVLFAFLLSLLLINDMLPWFNNLLSTRLSFSSFSIKTFIGRIVAFETTNEEFQDKFDSDIARLYEIYGGADK